MSFSITSALIVMGGLGLLFGIGLAIASRVFFVKKDPRVEQIEEALPGAHCGACGAPGCSGYAEGVVEGKYEVNGCTAGGNKVAAEISKIMGVDAGEIGKNVRNERFTMVSPIVRRRCLSTTVPRDANTVVLDWEIVSRYVPLMPSEWGTMVCQLWMKTFVWVAVNVCGHAPEISWK